MGEKNHEFLLSMEEMEHTAQLTKETHSTWND